MKMQRTSRFNPTRRSLLIGAPCASPPESPPQRLPLLGRSLRHRSELIDLWAIDPFVLKMALRKALAVIKRLRRHISDADEDSHREAA
jgi:hypothetical protein